MTVLPIELRKYQHLRYIKKRGKMEWSSECVVCGDVGHRTRDWPDRFRMFAQGHQGRDARAFCRSCGHFEWANQRGKTLSPQQMLAIETERKRLAEEERARMQRKIERLERSAYWRGYHDSMGDNERRLWQKEGINNSYQDYFELGYDPNRKFYYEDELRSSPALTIPYFQPDEEKVKQIATVQFRLLEPVEPGDKYRFMSDLQAPLYLPDPHRKPQGVCLLVEGGKKGMVAFMWLRQYVDCVVASPGKTMSSYQVDMLDNCGRVYLVFDPDANWMGQSQRAAHKIGKERVRIGSLPAKLDDMIVKYGATSADVWRYIKLARPA